MDAAIAGLLTGLSLIVAIAAQNAYVLRQGLLRNHVGLCVAICAAADALLIAAGVAGFGVVVSRHPGAITVFRWAGAAYLTVLGVQAVVRAFRDQGLDPSSAPPAGRRTVALTTAALTFLNPHVYLDTVILLGALGSQHPGSGRWWFALGAATASVAWFTALGFGARSASGLVRRPSAWRAIDAGVALVMFAMAVRLALM